jgi:molybdopterin-guanine dinucleotide biosynthesis protein A
MANPSESIAGIVLAGGRGRRLGGRDKAFVTLAGHPLIARAIARLRPQVAAVAINANGDPSRFAPFSLPVLADPMPDFAGPLAGVLAGLEWARGLGAERLATVAVDTPFFPSDLVARLAAAGDAETVSVASSGGRRHPTFALIPVALAGDLALYLRRGESLKVADWLARHGAAEAPCEGDDPGAVDPFFNINTSADLAKAEGLVLASPLQEP